MASREKEKWGWLAALVAAVILGVGRIVYSVFRFVFGLLESAAS